MDRTRVLRLNRIMDWVFVVLVVVNVSTIILTIDNGVWWETVLNGAGLVGLVAATAYRHFWRQKLLDV